MMCSISQKTRELFLGKIFVSISRVTETYCGSYWKIKLSETKEATTEKKKRLEPLGLMFKDIFIVLGRWSIETQESSPRTQIKQTDKPNKKQGGPFLN